MDVIIVKFEPVREAGAGTLANESTDLLPIAIFQGICSL